MAQSNERSRDVVNMRSEINNIAQKIGSSHEKLSHKLPQRAPSSLSQLGLHKANNVVSNVTARELEQVSVQLLPGMSHLRGPEDLRPAFEVSKRRRGMSIPRSILTFLLLVFICCFSVLLL